MFVHRLQEPIDDFDDTIPLPQWIARVDAASGTWWALCAVLALNDTAPAVGWRGNMCHLPSVGRYPDGEPFLLVKQDDNGSTFVIGQSEDEGQQVPANV